MTRAYARSTGRNSCGFAFMHRGHVTSDGLRLAGIRLVSILPLRHAMYDQSVNRWTGLAFA